MGNSSYFCRYCKKTRRFRFIEEDHQKLVEVSPNGLVTYSDIHICSDGLMSVNNLSVDPEFNVRTFEKLQLPDGRMPQGSIPIPKRQELTYRMEIKQTPKDLDIHIVIKDGLTSSLIQIGRFDDSLILPITTLTSDMGFIHLEVYPTGEAFTPQMELWLSELVKILEILPPTLLGLVMEAFGYIAINKDRAPTTFDIKFIKTILASHEVYFFLQDAEGVKNIKTKYGDIISEEDYANIERFIRILRENTTSAVRDFTSNPRINMSLISLIYLFHILEDEGIILIERPGIIEN